MAQDSRINSFLGLLRPAGPAPLGPERRASAMAADALERALAPHLPGLTDEDAALIRALLLLWHDHLDASHEISQDTSGADGSFVHGIMHRREPDYWNSKYWFRRVGSHHAFPEIARRVSALLDERRATQTVSWDSRDAWDPFAFVDAVAAACSRTGVEDQRAVLRDVQQIEFEVLLEHFAARA